MTNPAQCVVVLDTNVLHSVKLYLSYAEDRHRYPHHGVQWSATQAHIQTRVNDPSVRLALLRGGQVLHFMHCNRAELVRSSAVEAEWFRLEASSRALRNAMMQTRVVRGRWFSQLSAGEVNRWMTARDRGAVIASLEETFNTLDLLGIRVSNLGPTSSSDVVWLARGIMTLVYLDAMDSVVYATALVAAATHLVTSDSPFRAMVNSFKNPSSALAEARSKELASLVRVCTGMELKHHEFPASQTIARLSP